ncbi:MAG: alkaline phosphatase family protein [Acidobacteria bacterium]|nr:alkaline phosphatase family protein [Acidobacteriota bacterium]
MRPVSPLRKLTHNQRQINRWPVWPWQIMRTVDHRWLTEAKVLVVGLDAADWRILSPLLKQDRLPNLYSLIRRGSWGRLKTLIPALSPRLWNSIATGKRPQKHGILGFVVRHPVNGKRLPYTSNMRKCQTIWDILSAHGKRVSVVGWWNTWPATPVNGAMVSGITRYKLKDFEGLRLPDDEPASLDQPAPKGWFQTVTDDGQSLTLLEYPRKSSLQAEASNRQTYPEELFNEIRPLIRPHTQIDDAPSFIRRAWITAKPLSEPEKVSLALLAQIHNDDRTYAAIGKFLWNKLRPDFLSVYFAGIDVVGHRFWLYMEPEKFDVTVEPDKIEQYKDVVRSYYVFVDEMIGEYLRMVDEETCVVVVSDHGMSASQRKLDISGGFGSAEHMDEDGIIIMAGKYIKPGNYLGSPSILDVTPTLLTLMGLPVGADMDGRVMKRAFRDGFLDRHPIRYISTYDVNVRADDVPIESPMDDQILERLRALGYIE